MNRQWVHPQRQWPDAPSNAPLNRPGGRRRDITPSAVLSDASACKSNRWTAPFFNTTAGHHDTFRLLRTSIAVTAAASPTRLNSRKSPPVCASSE